MASLGGTIQGVPSMYGSYNLDPFNLQVSGGNINDIIRQQRAQFRETIHIPVYRQYATGNHPVVLTTKQKTILRNLLAREFSDNVCHQIISEACSRIKLLKWTCADKAVQDYLDALYTSTGILSLQDRVYYEGLRDGNIVMGVRWDAKKQRNILWCEPWWDGNDGIFVLYDTYGEMACVVKDWWVQEGGTKGVRVKYRFIWYADRIERYMSYGGDEWAPRMLPDDITWPQPWLRQDGRPLNIPFVHFPNSGKDLGDYGSSELSGGVLGFQDQINDLQWSLSSAGRMTGYQMYWATGVQQKRDAPGTSLPTSPQPDNASLSSTGLQNAASSLQVAPGNFFTSTNPQSRFGVLPAGSIDQLLAAYKAKLQRLAQMTQTPYHSITGGDWPSGDALLRAELPSVGKAWKQINRFTVGFQQLAHRAIELRNRFMPSSNLNEDIEDAMIIAKFEDPEKRDIVSRSLVVHNMAANVSIQESLRILGYSESDAQKITAEIIQNKKDIAEIAPPPAPAPIPKDAGASEG